jgi:hypothetical protein
MPSIWSAVFMPIVLATAPAFAAQQDPHLARYEARTIVTGSDMRSRPAGFAACLTDVLVKVSGDPTLLNDPRLSALGAQAANYVTAFDYWDRMSGIAHHDEQGSSDRPYSLTVRFAPTRIDAALRALGRTPWPDPRPALVMRVHVTAAHDDFDLTMGEQRAADMRASVIDAAQKYDMDAIIPADRATPPAGVPLVGKLVLSEAALGWVASWHLDWQDTGYDWGVSGVNFDEAFRDGIRGAMQILSGHGTPR